MASGGLAKIKEIISTRYKKITRSPYKKFNLNWFQVKYYKHAPKNKQYSHRLNKNITVHFANPAEFLLSVRELFIEEIYRFRSTTPQPVILDCGAHIGMSLLFFKLNYPGASITAFEPDPENYRLAAQNLLSWGFEKVDIRPEAIW